MANQALRTQIGSIQLRCCQLYLIIDRCITSFAPPVVPFSPEAQTAGIDLHRMKDHRIQDLGGFLFWVVAALGGIKLRVEQGPPLPHPSEMASITAESLILIGNDAYVPSTLT